MNLIAYSGSDNDFDEFDLKYVGTASGIEGAGYGIYFSTSKADALGYGDIVYECYLQLTGNNVSNTQVDFQPTQLRAIVDYCQTKLDKNLYSKEFPTNEERDFEIKQLIDNGKSDVDIINKIINYLFNGKCKDFLPVLVKYGFTHTIDNETPENETTTHYIVYDTDSITINEKHKILE